MWVVESIHCNFLLPFGLCWLGGIQVVIDDEDHVDEITTGSKVL